MLEPGSRYYALDNATYEDADGQVIIYKQRRFLPQGINMPLLLQVTVTTIDRLDLIAARAYGASEHFWRIADANNALNPFDLTDQIGSVLRISPPQF